MSENPHLEQLRAARTKLEIAKALVALERAPARIPIDPLLAEMAADGHWLVRHAAIGALGNAAGDAEGILLRLAQTSEDPHDLACINAALGRVNVASFFDDFLPRKRDKLTEDERALLEQVPTESDDSDH